MTQPNEQAFLTIVTSDYAAFARTWADSILRFEPDKTIYIAFADSITPETEQLFADVTILKVAEIAAELQIPNYQRMAFQYTPFELTCALKPFLLRYLLHEQKQVIYLDADTWACHSFDSVFEKLHDSSVLLTPHLGEPTSRNAENRIRQSGTLNGGFVAVSRMGSGMRFLDWWADRCRTDSVVDPYAGKFVDQTWLALVPTLFDDVLIDRSKNLNVAYWNLKQRRIGFENGSYQVAGRPLVFFHFSGYEPTNPKRLSRFMEGSLVGNNQRLLDEYGSKLRKHIESSSIEHACDFNTYSNGDLIDTIDREAIRLNHPRFADVLDPFDVERNPNLPEDLKSVRSEMVLSRKHWQLEELQCQADKQTEWIQKQVDRRFSKRLKRWFSGAKNVFHRKAS